ncbi:hypothetical protein ACFYZ8_33505 [Streptomyces sp. NPDC001668]|uniref:hypothetical protein n=1 Tax=Streptomyces sp. NPDC001668 TaxID=3364598 RepID=UPI0036AEC07D
MNSFSVYVEFARKADLDTYDRLLQALPERYRPAVGPAENGNISVRLLIDTDTVPRAFTLGVEAAQGAGIAADITPDTVIHAEVMTEAEFDRREAQLPAPAVPPLAGIHEAADILGVSEAEVTELAPELEPHLVQDLASGPVYLAAGVVETATRHALSPDDQSLLHVLYAASVRAPLPDTAPSHRAAAAYVGAVLDDGSVQIHCRADAALDLGAALRRLADRTLVIIDDTHGIPGERREGSAVAVMRSRITERGKRHASMTGRESRPV